MFWSFLDLEHEAIKVVALSNNHQCFISNIRVVEVVMRFYSTCAFCNGEFGDDDGRGQTCLIFLSLKWLPVANKIFSSHDAL